MNPQEILNIIRAYYLYDIKHLTKKRWGDRKYSRARRIGMHIMDKQKHIRKKQIADIFECSRQNVYNSSVAVYERPEWYAEAQEIEKIVKAEAQKKYDEQIPF